MRIDRKQFLEEAMLRKYISKKLRSVLSEKSYAKHQDEVQLRKIIRSILKEEESAEKAPHSSTGINVLADVLKKIIPVIEDDYKRLTTEPIQRESYRAHIINAAQNAIAPVSATSQGDEEAEQELSSDEISELEEIEVVMGDEAEELEAGGDIEGEDAGEEPDEGAFIDINDSPAPEEEEDTFGIEGKDDTGRNFAQTTFDKIEKQIIDAYALLGNDEDKELFYSYLVTNLKLYFDRFEDELASVLPEPTNQEYEDEKEDQESENDVEQETGDEEDAGDEEELDLDL